MKWLTRILISLVLSVSLVAQGPNVNNKPVTQQQLNTTFVGAGYVVLPNYKAVQVFKSNAGTGDVDLYTVPAGRRAIVELIFWNSTASSVTSYAEVKIGSTYYAVSTPITLASTSTAQTNQIQYNIVLEATQKASVHTSGSGINATGIAHEFDNSSNLKSSVITTFINGDNTVYTCCSAGHATAYTPAHIVGVLAGNANSAQLQVGNNTGGTLSYKWNFVPSGSSAATSNQITNSQSLAATSGSPVLGSFNTQISFTSGDSASVNGTSTNAAQIAWVNVVEQ